VFSFLLRSDAHEEKGCVRVDEVLQQIESAVWSVCEGNTWPFDLLEPQQKRFCGKCNG